MNWFFFLLFSFVPFYTIHLQYFYKNPGLYRSREAIAPNDILGKSSRLRNWIREQYWNISRIIKWDVFRHKPGIIHSKAFNSSRLRFLPFQYLTGPLAQWLVSVISEPGVVGRTHMEGNIFVMNICTPKA